MWTSTRCYETVVIGLLECRHAEVRNSDVQVLSQEDILWLQIAVADVKLVTVPNRAQHLSEVLHCLYFCQAAICDNVIEELASVCVLEDKISKMRC